MSQCALSYIRLANGIFQRAHAMHGSRCVLSVISQRVGILMMPVKMMRYL